MLRVKVVTGELPPVEKGLLEEPLVAQPFGEIGQYGGTAPVFGIAPNIWNDCVWAAGSVFSGFPQRTTIL